MAQFKTLCVKGFTAAIHGMRMPMKSLDKADSWVTEDNFYFGENDYKLAANLCKAGPEHAKWMRQVYAWVDITAPRFWWSEFDTYKIGTSANSESTMHTITKKVLSLSDFELPERLAGHAELAKAFKTYLDVLNSAIAGYNLPVEMEGDKEWKEECFQIIKAFLPESFVQTRTVCISYAALANMYAQRKNHRLPQWNKDFVEWVHTLPYSEFITREKW